MVKETYQAVYKSDENKDLFVYVEDTELLNKWKHDSTIPLAQVIQAFEIYETENGSHTGKATAASKSTISNTLGTDDLDKAIKKIITEGELIRAPTFNERVKDI